MFAVEIAGDIRPGRYPDKDAALIAARRAAKNAPGASAAVVWLNDQGTPKVWLAHIKAVPRAANDFRRTVVVTYTDHWTN
jgi:hypothetical protein